MKTQDSRPGAAPATFSWLNEAGGTATGCGIKQKEDAMNEAAFYCYNDHVLYLDITFLNYMDATYGAQGVQAVVAHEYGHHIEDDFKVQGSQNSRNLELYADYASGLFMKWWLGDGTTVNVATYSQQFIDAGDPIGTSPGAPGAHGTGVERMTAFNNGFQRPPDGTGPVEHRHRLARTRCGECKPLAAPGPC